MDDVEHQKIHAIAPGVVEAYRALGSKHYRGIHTSNGAFYNHTVFGRDSAMAAKFIVDFDHRTALEVIEALAHLQGVATNRKTGEERGRIHHEWRDFRLWKANTLDRTIMRISKHLWGGSRHVIHTYFAADTTAEYIRLVHKYATHIDHSVLERVIMTRAGEKITISETIERAAEWLRDQIDDDGIVRVRRTNRFALPYQTFQDSVTAYCRLDGSLANYKKPLAFVEVQAFTADAFYDVSDLLPGHQLIHEWRATYDRVSFALLDSYWRPEIHFMTGCIDAHGIIDRDMISPAWTLNVSLWDRVPEKERNDKISAIIRRMFSDDFLTDVGLRSRALSQAPILPGLIEYHGRLTVWPMFTFMMIEGLRRHHLYRLAAQLENRLLNGMNISGKFDEFLIVGEDGRLLVRDEKYKGVKRRVQMIPEENIAFSIVPTLVTAWRATQPAAKPVMGGWQQELEDDIMAKIPFIERRTPAQAKEGVRGIDATDFSKFRGLVTSVRYFMKQSRGMK